MGRVHNVMQVLRADRASMHPERFNKLTYSYHNQRRITVDCEDDDSDGDSDSVWALRQLDTTFDS